MVNLAVSRQIDTSANSQDTTLMTVPASPTRAGRLLASSAGSRDMCEGKLSLDGLWGLKVKGT